MSVVTIDLFVKYGSWLILTRLGHTAAQIARAENLSVGLVQGGIALAKAQEDRFRSSAQRSQPPRRATSSRRGRELRANYETEGWLKRHRKGESVESIARSLGEKAGVVELGIWVAERAEIKRKKSNTLRHANDSTLSECMTRVYSGAPVSA